MSETIQVRRRATWLDYTHDLTKVISPNIQPLPGRALMVPISAPLSASIAPEADPSPWLDIQTMEVPVERFGYTTHHERVTKTEQWGDTTVQYIDVYQTHYKWLALDSTKARLR